MRRILAFVALAVALLSAVPLVHADVREGRVADENPYESLPR